MDDANAIAEVRAFNRFYTQYVGMLNEALLKSRFSPTEARVLYEIGSRGETTAAALAGMLRLDPAHLSRILRRFRAAGLVGSETGDGDRRTRMLALLDEGRRAFEALDAASRQEIGAMLDRLAPIDRDELVAEMKGIRCRLDETHPQTPAYVIRPHRNGDASWVIHRQSMLYAAEFGWNGEYEALITGIFADFLKSHDPRREHFWVAERGGRVVGSIVLVDGGDAVAKLRLLYVEPSARGLGIGGRLVSECMAFARAAGYRRMTLWTNDVLASARRIYQAAGFALTREEPHRSFGKDLIGQTWECDL